MPFDPKFVLPIIGCLLTSTVYAFLLSTRVGRYLCSEQTWLTVVVGTLIVLGWVATVDVFAAVVTGAFFVAGGVPMILRSLLIQFEHYKAQTTLRQRDRGDD